MEQIDLKRQMKPYWAPPRDRFTIVDVPRLQFVMIDGEGDPNTSATYARAVEWLYSLSYALKFASKKQLGRDYSVAPLEALWWADDLGDFAAGARDRWKWTAMIMQPDWITEAMFENAMGTAKRKLGEAPASLRFEPFEEGRSVQIMHIGPYSAEGPTIARLHGEFLPANVLVENGHHHEIYVGDPRRAAPERLKTVIRQPVRAAPSLQRPQSRG